MNNLYKSKYDWAKVGPTIATCLALHKQAEKLKGEMEKAYRQRDELLAPINFVVKGSKNYLKGKYGESPKKLGDWGFEIDDTPKTPKKKS